MNVVFYGGRQARELCGLYNALVEAPARWIDAGAALHPLHEQGLAEAHVIAIQSIAAQAPVDLDAIEAKAERVLFPTLALDCLWPFGGQPHPRNTGDALFPEGPFPTELGDAWLNRRLAGRDRLEAVAAEYLALDVAAVLDLDAFLQASLERQAAADAMCGEDFAGRFEAGFRTRALFANPLTPAPELTRDLANRLFQRIGAGVALPEDWRPAPAPELPIHPSIVDHFGLDFAHGRRHRLAAGEAVDFAEYVRRYLSYAEGPELEAALKHGDDGRAQAAAKALEAAMKRPMARRSLAARRAKALAAVADLNWPEAASGLADEASPLIEALGAFAEGRFEAAEAALLAYQEAAAEAPGAFAFLARVREKRGDAEGQAAALRSALALRPHDGALQSRLTLALSGQGDLPAAVASAEAEVALNPGNPHARTFLSHLLGQIGETERARVELGKALAIVAEGAQYADLREALNRRRIDPA